MSAKVLTLGKWIVGIFVLLVGLALIDLYTVEWVFEDPGYYVVAQHSDRPAQVMDALDRLRDDPELSRRDWRRLIKRYRFKQTDQSLDQQERERWTEVLEKASRLHQETGTNTTP